MPSESSSSRLCDQVKSLLQGLNELRGRLRASAQPSATAERSAGLAQLTEGTADSSRLDAAAVQRQVAQLQQQLQQVLATAASVDLDPAIEQRLRPHQTEAHRRSRLLGIEAMRLQTARQPATIERQRSQIEDHTNQLQKFLQAIADEIC